jgi:hypothetical protein
LEIKSGEFNKLEISFKRTVRVPDDGTVHKLPPGLGNFPLFNIDRFKNRLPEEMESKGGVFLPIYRKKPLYQVY